MRLTIPTELSDITLEQFILFQKVMKESQTDEFISLAMVTIFCDLTVNEAQSIEMKDFNEIVAQLTEVLKQEPRHIERFIYNGKEYGFIPNLDDITSGEYIDLETYLKDEKDYGKAMNILYRPIERKMKGLYNIEEYKGQHTDFKDLNIEIVLGSLLFFWTLSNELLTYTKAYLEQPKNRTLLEEVLMKNGVGINQFLALLEETSSTLRERLSYGFTSF